MKPWLFVNETIKTETNERTKKIVSNEPDILSKIF